MDNPEEILEYLISVGAIKRFGYNDEGEELFRMTEKCDEFMPEFSQLFYEDFSNNIFMLWQDEFLDVVFDDDGDPLVSPTKKAYDEDSWEELDLEALFILKQIIAIFEEQ